jgi:hypothetical protein
LSPVSTSRYARRDSSEPRPARGEPARDPLSGAPLSSRGRNAGTRYGWPTDSLSLRAPDR